MQQSEIQQFLAEMNGTIEALVLSYGALLASHQDPSKPAALLGTLAKSTIVEESDSPAQKAYKTGMSKAVSKLAQAAKLAEQVRQMQQSGPRQ